MATIVGTIKSLQGGKFFVKDENGNIQELNHGDMIYENQTVFGDSSNSSAARVEILLADNEVIVLNQGQKQLLDASLIETAFGNEELFFTRETLSKLLGDHEAIADVGSDLRETKFIDDKNITEEETTEGQEEAEDEEADSSSFAARDGSLTDVESDLRKKAWAITRTFNEAEKMDALQNLTKKELGSNPNSPFEPTIPTNPRPVNPIRPGTDKPKNEKPKDDRPESDIERPGIPSEPSKPTPPPSDNIIPLKIAGVSSDTKKEGDTLVHNVVFKQKSQITTEVIVSMKGGNKLGQATLGEDTKEPEFWADGKKLNFIKNPDGTYSVEIPSGLSGFEIKVPTIDDDIYEGNEKYDITVSVNNSSASGVGIITDEKDAPTVEPKDPNDPSKPLVPGIIPQDPNDLPKDPLTNKPLIPGYFEGNTADQTTKDVKVPEGNDAVFKTTVSNPSTKDEIVKITIITTVNTDGKASDEDIERPNVKFYGKDGKELEFTKNPDGTYDVKLPKGETEFYTVVPTVQDSTYEGDEIFGISATINGTISNATGTITDENDVPVVDKKDPDEPSVPSNPEKPEEPTTGIPGIIPLDPNDPSFPRDPDTDEPKIPGFFDGNNKDVNTGDVKVPEGNDALFKVTVTNPTSVDSYINVTVGTTEGSIGKASEDDIDRDNIQFYDKNGNELTEANGGLIIKPDGTYDVLLPKGETEFFVVVPTEQDSTYEGDETFTVTVKDSFNNTDSATGTIWDINDTPTVDEKDPEDPDEPSVPSNPEKPEEPTTGIPGIIPLDPNDPSFPRDPDTDEPKIPGFFDGNNKDVNTGDVKVPEGNDALFKVTVTNPTSVDSYINVTVGTTEGSIGKASEDDIDRDNIQFYDKNGNELTEVE